MRQFITEYQIRNRIAPCAVFVVASDYEIKNRCGKIKIKRNLYEKNSGHYGGMGTMATVDLFKKIAENTHAVSDQDHLHIP